MLYDQFKPLVGTDVLRDEIPNSSLIETLIRQYLHSKKLAGTTVKSYIKPTMTSAALREMHPEKESISWLYDASKEGKISSRKNDHLSKRNCNAISFRKMVVFPWWNLIYFSRNCEELDLWMPSVLYVQRTHCCSAMHGRPFQWKLLRHWRKRQCGSLLEHGKSKHQCTEYSQNVPQLSRERIWNIPTR